MNDRGLSRKHIFESIDQTLKNMQTDYLDMYFCHRFDETTDLTETLRAMSDLVAQGRVPYYGVSEEWGSAHLEEAQRIIDRYNLYPITVVQPQYNLQDRYIEHEIMGTCKKLGTNPPILSMAWILQHPQISCVIAGASKPSQMENNVKASGFGIPADAMAEIDRITGFHRFERHVG